MWHRHELVIRPPTVVRLSLYLFVLALITPRSAFGYIDPLSGSIILQVIAAGVLAGVLTAKRLWLRITGVIRRAWTRLTR